MAKLNGLKPLFGLKQINSVLEQKKAEYESKSLEILRFKGEQFVNKARSIDTYQDRTGNLRSSIGYVILKDGKVIDWNFASSPKGTGGRKGTAEGRLFADEVASQYPRGFVLIGVAGMNYAAYVETKGYDVITGSAPTEKGFRSLFDAIKF